MLGVALAAYRFVGRVRGRSLGQWTHVGSCISGDRNISGMYDSKTKRHLQNTGSGAESIWNSPMS